MRIRHYGILSSSRKQKSLPVIHQLFNSEYQVHEKKGWKEISTQMGFNPDCCPACKLQTMITVLTFDRRGPPDSALITELKHKYLRVA
jgi:hypothetical protein